MRFQNKICRLDPQPVSPVLMKVFHLFLQSNLCDISTAFISAEANLVSMNFQNQGFRTRAHTYRGHRTNFSCKRNFDVPIAYDMCFKVHKVTSMYERLEFSYGQSPKSNQTQGGYDRSKVFTDQIYPHLRRRSAVMSVILSVIAAFVGTMNPPPSSAVAKTAPRRRENRCSSNQFFLGVEQYIYSLFLHSPDLFSAVSRLWRPASGLQARSRFINLSYFIRSHKAISASIASCNRGKPMPGLCGHLQQSRSPFDPTLSHSPCARRA